MASSIVATKVAFEINGCSILENLDFEVEQGSFFSVIGPNGAGKSFLMKLILNLESVSSGELRVVNQLPEDLNLQRVGYVPQVKSFDRSFPATTRDFVISGIRSSWPSQPSENSILTARAALARVHAESLELQQLSELSGGELQRAYLARAFSSPRSVLILDEPATGIDTLGEYDLYETLELYRKETQATIVMVTHDVEVARHHSDQVLILNRTQIAFGTPEQALSPENLERAFGHSQHSHGGPSHG